LTKNSKSDFSREPLALSSAIRLCHWLTALAVFYLLISSWWMLSLPLPSEHSTFRVLPFQLHKNVGLTLFLLLLAMTSSFILRWIKANAWIESKQQITAKIGHSLIYLTLLLCCLSGYLSSSFSGWGTQFWWLFDLPIWARESDDLNAMFSDLHLWSCWFLIFLIVAHIGAALHHSFRNDGVVDSMLGSPNKN
jgi:cytochrome b561